jgi:multidrug efflux pump
LIAPRNYRCSIFLFQYLFASGADHVGGLIAKNGILIVEFANQLQIRGYSRMMAVREAALIRLRPVLMRSAATVFGHLPLVVGGSRDLNRHETIG